MQDNVRPLMRDSSEAGISVALPRHRRSPLRAISVRLGAALLLVAFTVVVVYSGRSGYRDATGSPLSLLDSIYYTVVSLSTTGYGDITPASPSARALNVILITPARILFLIILVGTTLEVLTEQSRALSRLKKWRRTVHNHVVVCGYGTKGRTAVQAMLDEGTHADRIVVVESHAGAAREASSAGLVVIEGSATRTSVLAEANVKRAKAVVVATHSDDAAVLIVLTARRLAGPETRIVAAVRESENVALLKQSGAHQVVVSSETAGRLLGISTSAPPVVDVVSDLLASAEGMALHVRGATRDEVGAAPRSLPELVIALVRRGSVVRIGEPKSETIETGDLLVVIRNGDARPPA